MTAVRLAPQIETDSREPMRIHLQPEGMEEDEEGTFEQTSAAVDVILAKLELESTFCTID